MQNSQQNQANEVADKLIDLLLYGNKVNEAINLVLTRRPQLERALDSLTHGNLKTREYERIAREVADAVFCDEVDPRGENIIHLAKNILITFLTIRSDCRITLIKEMRLLTGMSLKDSKAVIDRVMSNSIPMPKSLLETFGLTEELQQQVKDYRDTVESLRSEALDRATQVRVLETDNETQRKVIDETYVKLDAARQQVYGLEEVIKMASIKLYEPHKTIVEGSVRALREQAQKTCSAY